MLDRLSEVLDKAIADETRKRPEVWRMVSQLENTGEDLMRLAGDIPKIDSKAPERIFYTSLAEIFGQAAGRAVFALLEYAVSTLDVERHKAADARARGRVYVAKQPAPIAVPGISEAD